MEGPPEQKEKGGKDRKKMSAKKRALASKLNLKSLIFSFCLASHFMTFSRVWPVPLVFTFLSLRDFLEKCFSLSNGLKIILHILQEIFLSNKN